MTRAAETGRQSRRCRACLEPLEDRNLLATYLVTSTADDGSSDTLRWAINQTNLGYGGEAIDFQIGLQGSL